MVALVITLTAMAVCTPLTYPSVTSGCFVARFRTLKQCELSKKDALAIDSYVKIECVDMEER